MAHKARNSLGGLKLLKDHPVHSSSKSRHNIKTCDHQAEGFYCWVALPKKTRVLIQVTIILTDKL